MKKYFNRFLALVMSMLMIFGCSFTCFAAETDDIDKLDVSSSEDYLVVDFDVCEDWVSGSDAVELAINQDGSVSLVGTRETDLLSASGSNETSSSRWSDDFYTDRNGTLHVWISVSGSCHINVKLRLKGSIITTDWLDKTLPSGSGEFFSTDTISGGSHVEITLNQFSNGTNWSIRAWVD